MESQKLYEVEEKSQCWPWKGDRDVEERNVNELTIQKKRCS